MTAVTETTKTEESRVLHLRAPLDQRVHIITEGLLRSSYIPQEVHATIEAWKKLFFAHPGHPKAPYILCDLVCRVLRPQSCKAFELEIEKILGDFFDIEDPKGFIEAYNDMLLKATRYMLIDTLFRQAKELLTQCAKAVNSDFKEHFMKLKQVCLQLNDKRDVMTTELHAQLDALNEKETRLRERMLASADDAVIMSERLLALRISHDTLLNEAEAIAEEAKK